METKIYHGNLTAANLAKALAARFTYGDLFARAVKSGDQHIVQISTRNNPSSGGKTAIGVTIQEHEDGVVVKVGKQDWLGIAASLGKSAVFLRMNPLNLLSRLDDIAQDIENLSLDDKIWEAIDEVAQTMGATLDLSERLKRIGCEYCGTANPVGQPRCLACGAPLGSSQPRTCENCGYVAAPVDTRCQNCNEPL
jgi:hypothetical protein